MNIYIFAKRVAIGALIVFLIGAAFYLIKESAYFFMLVFSGILLAVLLCGITDFLVDKLHFKRGIGLFTATVIVFGSLIGAFWLIAPTVSAQFSEMRSALPNALNQVENWLSQYSWGERVVQKIPEDLSSIMPKQQAIVSKLGGVFSSTMSFLADFLIVVITALFFAASPKIYTEGLVKLFPVRNRDRLSEVLKKCYHTLKMWLVGMLSAMAIIGISTAIGYSLIGLPMAFALALIAFLLAFIPNIGPLLAGLPAILIGLTQGPQMALYVLLIYGGVQLIESYVITPIIFQKTVDLPPALLLFFQVLLGILVGAMGLLMAAPILAVLVVLVNELYIKDVLEAEPLNAGKEPLQGHNTPVQS